MLRITNEAGQTFRVRCVRKGQRYGLHDCLVHDGDEPLVEFTAVTPGPRCAPACYFVARYPAGVVLRWPDGEGLLLHGRALAWGFGPDQVQQVQGWLRDRCPRCTAPPCR
jgi:hypothetical protein